METVFVDESGYSGGDLLNTEQPVFALGSMCCTEDVCLDLKRAFFHRVQARELKHFQMAKYGSQQRMVVSFLQYLDSHRDLFRFTVVHKRYALVCKIVDIVIETVMREDGYDLYERGGNIALANLFYYTLPVFMGEDSFVELLGAFQAFLRQLTDESYHAFFDVVESGMMHDGASDLQQMLLLCEPRLDLSAVRSAGRLVTDLAVTSAFCLMAEWRGQVRAELELIHDRASDMASHRDVWDAVTDPSVDPVLLGYDRRTLALPLSVRPTRFEESVSFAGLQLSDIIAGASNRVHSWLLAGRPVEDVYSVQLAECFANWSPTMCIWPRPEVDPVALGTNGPKHGDGFEDVGRIIGRM